MRPVPRLPSPRRPPARPPAPRGPAGRARRSPLVAAHCWRITPGPQALAVALHVHVHVHYATNTITYGTTIETANLECTRITICGNKKVQTESSDTLSLLHHIRGNYNHVTMTCRVRSLRRSLSLRHRLTTTTYRIRLFHHNKRERVKILVQFRDLLSLSYLNVYLMYFTTLLN